MDAAVSPPSPKLLVSLPLQCLQGFNLPKNGPLCLMSATSPITTPNSPPIPVDTTRPCLLSSSTDHLSQVHPPSTARCRCEIIPTQRPFSIRESLAKAVSPMAALHSRVFLFGVQWMDSLLCALDSSVRGDYIAFFFCCIVSLSYKYYCRWRARVLLAA